MEIGGELNFPDIYGNLIFKFKEERNEKGSCHSPN